ncbi:hypothetical protein T05_14472, partial [Trichinella murrelli]
LLDMLSGMGDTKQFINKSEFKQSPRGIPRLTRFRYNAVFALSRDSIFLKARNLAMTITAELLKDSINNIKPIMDQFIEQDAADERSSKAR